jgi:pimeloyl-ACP methyl ester carboxylesterase
MISSCAIAPAGLKRSVSREEKTICRLGLEELLLVALEEPNTGRSAHALGHFVERWKAEKNNAISGTLKIAHGEPSAMTYHITFENPVHRGFPLEYFDEIAPASDYSISKLPDYKRDGVGSPLMALRENRGQHPIERYYPPEAITAAVTAVLQPGKISGGSRQIRISLLCPLRVETVSVKGKDEPLAADFSVPWAALLSRGAELNGSKVSDLLRSQPKRDPQLYLMEPYDPQKIPLLMIHGLISTPLMWAKISNELWADDAVRRKYQIWQYLYNTSAPALYSARILQQQLHEVRQLLDPEQDDPAMQSMTLIAHSMGGIVSRRLTTEPDDAFWEAAFTRPIDELKLSKSDRRTLEKAFFWKAEKQIDRVIFIAVPHRGSHYADNWIGKIGRALVRPPRPFTEFYNRISAANPGAFTPEYEQLGKGELDSVYALSPQQPTLKILSALPDRYRVNTHSIIGDRGRSVPVEKSSDGIVDYWSSHLPGTRSETMVPIKHENVNHPEVMKELKRILKLRD